MAHCTFCQRTFRSSQAVKAHLKRCSAYHRTKNQRAGALGTSPQAPMNGTTTVSFLPSPPSDLSASLREFMKSISDPAPKADAQPSAQERRRQLLQEIKARIVDEYRTHEGTISPAMRADVKLAIEEALGRLPLDELPIQELLEHAAAFRDRLYAPAFRRQTREANRQHAKQEAQRRRVIKEFGGLLRAARRKKLFLRQGNDHALAYCEKKRIIGWAALSVLSDVESRLTEFLTGEEQLPEAHAIIDAVIAARLAEAEAKLAAAQARDEQKSREGMAALLMLGALDGLVILAVTYPVQALPILTWIERIFGLQAGSKADPTKSQPAETEQTADSRSPRRRPIRRQKQPAPPSCPASPWDACTRPKTGEAPMKTGPDRDTVDRNPLREVEVAL